MGWTKTIKSLRKRERSDCPSVVKMHCLRTGQLAISQQRGELCWNTQRKIIAGHFVSHLAQNYRKQSLLPRPARQTTQLHSHAQTPHKTNRRLHEFRTYLRRPWRKQRTPSARDAASSKASTIRSPSAVRRGTGSSRKRRREREGGGQGRERERGARRRASSESRWSRTAATDRPTSPTLPPFLGNACGVGDNEGPRKREVAQEWANQLWGWKLKVIHTCTSIFSWLGIFWGKNLGGDFMLLPLWWHAIYQSALDAYF